MPPTDSRSGPRVLVTGDSWVRGLFRKQQSIATLFPAALGASAVLDVSKISRTAPDTVEGFLDEIERFRPDVALLAVGGADSLVFPALWLQRIIDRFAPPQWAGVTGLMPPAVLPSDRRRRLRKRVEIAGKTVVKQFMINVFGARRRVPLDEVIGAAETLMTTLERTGTVVVVLGCSDVDHLTFPKSTKNIQATNRRLELAVRSHRAATYIDGRTLVSKWGDYLDDHVHLTEDGHRLATDRLLGQLTRAGAPWAQVVSSARLTPTAVAG